MYSQYNFDNSLVIDSISDSNKFGQTNTFQLDWAMAGIKRKALLSRIPIINKILPKRYYSYVGKNLPVNGMLAHGGGPIHPGWTIDDQAVCQNPLYLDPKDPHFIAKTSGGLKMDDQGNFSSAYPDKIVGNFTSVNRFLTNISDDFIAATIDRKVLPDKTTRDKIESYLISVRECDKLDRKIILEQTATFAFRSAQNPKEWYEPVTDTIRGVMFFEWGIQGQFFTGAILGGTGKYAGATGEFHRQRLLAPNFAGGETFRIYFPGLPLPDYFPR